MTEPRGIEPSLREHWNDELEQAADRAAQSATVKRDVSLPCSVVGDFRAVRDTPEGINPALVLDLLGRKVVFFRHELHGAGVHP